MTTYPPLVEQWRSLVAKYFPAELVDKALHVIQYESSGNAKAVGDGGVAHGLFQIQDNQAFSNRPDGTFLQDPENNVRYAAEQLGGASGNFGAWGEGTQYNNKAFGALGNHPYEGPINGRADTTSGIRMTKSSGSAPTAPAPTAPATPPVGSGFGLGALKSAVLDKTANMGVAAKNAATLKGIKLPAPLVLSGDYAKDRASYNARVESANAAFEAYANSVSEPLTLKDGIVVRVTGMDEAGALISEIDPVANRLYGQLQSATAGLERLDASRKAGLDGSGRSAAEAYLASELSKVSLASQAHEAYVKQINDMVAMDNKPQERAATLASTLAIMNTVNKAGETFPGFNKTGAMGTVGMPRLVDTAPFTAAMKAQIPNSAPASYIQGVQPSPETPSIPAPIPEPVSSMAPGPITPITGMAPSPITGFGTVGSGADSANKVLAALGIGKQLPSAINTRSGNYSKFGVR